MKNKKVLIGLAVIAFFAIFAIYSFSSALNPYVSFAEAAETEATVQVMGYLHGGEVRYDMDSRQLRFNLEDEEGTTALVAYEGPKPANMDQAESIVVIGRFEEEIFQAQKILVKCPSKYEEEMGKD